MKLNNLTKVKPLKSRIRTLPSCAGGDIWSQHQHNSPVHTASSQSGCFTILRPQLDWNWLDEKNEHRQCAKNDACVCVCVCVWIRSTFQLFFSIIGSSRTRNLWRKCGLDSVPAWHCSPWRVYWLFFHSYFECFLRFTRNRTVRLMMKLQALWRLYVEDDANGETVSLTIKGYQFIYVVRRWRTH